MLDTDAKNAENRFCIKCIIFYDGRKFRRQCVNVIEIIFIFQRVKISDENFGPSVQ